SASRKAPVMQAKANFPKTKPAAALTVSPADCTDRALSQGCTGAPTRRRRVVHLCLFAKLELQMPTHSLQNAARRLPLLGILLALIVVAGVLIWLTAEQHDRRVDTKQNELSSQAKSRVFYPTADQWTTLTVEPVQQRVFQSERVTE